MSLSGYVWMGPPGAGLPGPVSLWGRVPGEGHGLGVRVFSRARPRQSCCGQARGMAQELGPGAGCVGATARQPRPRRASPTRFLRAPVTGLGQRERRATPALPPRAPVGRTLAAGFPEDFLRFPDLEKPQPRPDGPSHLCPSRGPQRVRRCPFRLASDTQTRALGGTPPARPFLL